MKLPFFSTPQTEAIPRIYYVQARAHNKSNKVILCRTLALDLQEAITRVVVKYGPIEVIATGTCIIPESDDPIYGRGEFLFSKYDNLLPPRAMLSMTQRAA